MKFSWSEKTGQCWIYLLLPTKLTSSLIMRRGYEKKMFEKEIKKIGNKTEWRISLAKKDGNIHEGKCFILYPEEFEELQRAKEDVLRLNKVITSLNNQINNLTTTHETDNKTIKQLKDGNTTKDNELKQLQKEKNDLNKDVDGLKQTLTFMKIQHDEKIKELTTKYNNCVDFIHSLISTIIFIQNAIKDMSFTKRAFSYKKNISSIFSDSNMDNLIKEHLIQEDSSIPERLLKKD